MRNHKEPMTTHEDLQRLAEKPSHRLDIYLAAREELSLGAFTEDQQHMIANAITGAIEMLTAINPPQPPTPGSPL